MEITVKEEPKNYFLQMKNITKYFGKFKALDGVDLNVKKGSVHALLGENGAGKTTLMNILYGLYQADLGEIFLNGEVVQIKNPSIAINLGIGMVHQHFKLVQNFTVAQNIMLGCEETSNFGILDFKEFGKKIKKIIEQYGLNVDLKAKIEDISVGMQQRVEILKTLYRGADLLILDEPTAVLTPAEIEELINIIFKLTSSGKTVIIITHKLKEIKAVAESCTVIRKGKYIDTLDVKSTTERELAKKMVGKDVKLVVENPPEHPGDVVFEIKDLCIKKDSSENLFAVNNLSLSIKKGEILGLAGVEGNGQKEIAEAIMGLRKVYSGSIKINGKEIQNLSPREVIKNKVSIIHEDRHKRGLILDFSVAENAVLEEYREKPFSKNGILNYSAINKFTKDLIAKYKVSPEKCHRRRIRKLSGGNQQKVIIGREVHSNPDLLIAMQPTRGLDVGAIEYVHKTLIEERDKGRAILLISLELDEILALSSRVAVIYNGEILGTFNREEANEENVGYLMAGGNENIA